MLKKGFGAQQTQQVDKKNAAFIYRSILNWLSLMTDQDFLWLTLMIDQNCKKLLEINRCLQLLVSTETINHILHCIKVKIISSVIWLTDVEHR